MKSFMEEYGRILVSAIVILVLVASANGIGGGIKDGMTAAVDSFTAKMEEITNKIPGGEGGSGEIGGSDIDMSTVDATLSNNSWETIQKVVSAGKATEAGWSVGDTKTLTINGAEQTATLIGLDHDGENTATFMVMENIGDHVMNSTSTNAGGWEDSEMRAWLNGDIYESMSNKDCIKEVPKLTDNVGYTGQENEVTVTQDKLFLLSVVEAGSQSKVEGWYSYMNQINAEGTTYEWFKSNSKSDNCFWLRSPESEDKYSFLDYRYGDIYDDYEASWENSVFAAFVIGQ